MAVYSYSSNNISFATFITWSNNESSLSNVDLDSAMGDMHPDQNPVAGNLRSITIFYGNVIAGANGTVGISSPYSLSAQTTIVVKNVILSSYSITLTAAGTYPYVFDSWRTASGGGGSVISSSSTLTITTTSNQTHANYYAYFV